MQYNQLCGELDPYASKVQVTEFLTLKPGDVVIGMLIGIEQVQNEKVKEPANRYIIDVGDKTVSILMGSATDGQLAGKLSPGDLVHITFHGKTSIDGGAKQLNRYSVRSVPSKYLPPEVVQHITDPETDVEEPTIDAYPTEGEDD